MFNCVHEHDAYVSWGYVAEWNSFHTAHRGTVSVLYGHAGESVDSAFACNLVHNSHSSIVPLQ